VCGPSRQLIEKFMTSASPGHPKYGLAPPIGWSGVHAAVVGFTAAPLLAATLTRDPVAAMPVLSERSLARARNAAARGEPGGAVR
jgi:hypothetical protein